MNFSAKFLILAIMIWLPMIAANAQEDNTTAGVVSEDLFVYIHSGPGNNYRILGSINAGDPLQIHPETENGFTKITDAKGRTAWLESKFVSTNPTLRSVIAELNGKIATHNETVSSLEAQLASEKSSASRLTRETQAQKKQIDKLSKQLAEQGQQLSNQDMAVKKEWFYTGAIVLCIGLLLGIIIPKLGGGRRRSQMDSWN